MQASSHILDSIALATTLQNEDPETAFLRMGPVWIDPPPLHAWKGEPGRSAHLAVARLLDLIEKKASSGNDLRAMLASCYQRSDRSFVLANLYFLPDDCKQDALSVLAWVSTVGGLRLGDFEDGGARFLRLVLRKQPQTIERILGGEEPSWT